jgi:hypothetical protein
MTARHADLCWPPATATAFADYASWASADVGISHPVVPGHAWLDSLNNSLSQFRHTDRDLIAE